MRGEVFRQLRELVEVAEDNGQLFWALNVSAVLNGSTKSLATMGEEALRRQLEQRLRPHGPSSWAEALAYEVTRAEPLAFLFDVLGLDCRLRHHRRALTVSEKAEVLRSMAGELQRGISEAKAPWCGALLREMTCCLLEMYHESLRGRDETPGRGSALNAPRPLQTDAKLGALLRSGSWREILERLVFLHEQEHGLGDQITLTLAASLPRLNLMRLLVFVRVLQDICSGEPGSPSVRLPTQELHPQQRASLASAVVRAVLASDLSAMPFEMEEQVEDVRLSPFLSDFERNGLLELMAATPRAPPTRSMAARTVVRASSVPEITRATVEMPNGSGSYITGRPTGRGAELRALRRPAPRMAEPQPQSRPRRPRHNDSYGFGYLPGHPMEDFEPEPAALGSMGPWRPPSLPPSPREAHRCWNCQNFFLPDSMYCRFCGLHRADPPSPSLQRAATAFQRLAEAAAREPRESREVPSRSASPRRVPSWGI